MSFRTLENRENWLVKTILEEAVVANEGDLVKFLHQDLRAQGGAKLLVYYGLAFTQGAFDKQLDELKAHARPLLPENVEMGENGD